MNVAQPIRQALIALLLASTFAASAQTPTPAPIERADPPLDAAQALIGRALFLRCLCVADNLTFDATGHPQSGTKPTDWTLAAVNIQKVERKDPATLELDGVRVAIRYAADRHEFDRHPLADEKIKLFIPDDGQRTAFAHRLDAIFAEGLDLRLQHAMPPFWQHYFQPQSPWTPDSLDGVTIATPANSPGMVEARATNHPEPGYTPAATHDRVQGLILLHMVVDATGAPRRISILQPIGYGLDARAVEAAEKLRFTPATTASGQPIAVNVQLRENFVVVPNPH